VIALAIQCPSCGLKLRHAAQLLSSIAGRRGTTRCPRCRDRIHIDLTGGALELSFPDLYAVPEQLAARIGQETVAPDAESGDRASYIAPKGEAPSSPLPTALAAPPIPKDLAHELAAGTQLFGSDLFGSNRDPFSSAPASEGPVGTEFDPFTVDESAASVRGSTPPLSEERELAPLVDAWELGEEAVFPLVIPRRLRR